MVVFMQFETRAASAIVAAWNVHTEVVAVDQLIPIFHSCENFA